MKVNYYPASHIRLSYLAEEVIIVNKFKSIFEQLVNTTSLITEEEGVELSADEKKVMDNLIGTFVDQLKKGAPEVKSTMKNEKELEKLKKEFPDLAKIEDEVNEDKLNEFVITAHLIAGLIAALPKLTEIFGYLVKGLGSVLSIFSKKGANSVKAFAEKIIHAGHELHHKYILGIKQGLIYLVPEFKDLDDKVQEKIAELIYMIIVMYLGMDAGVSTIKALQHADWVHVSIEGLLSAIKTGEIGAWLAKSIGSTIS